MDRREVGPGGLVGSLDQCFDGSAKDRRLSIIGNAICSPVKHILPPSRLDEDSDSAESAGSDQETEQSLSSTAGNDTENFVSDALKIAHAVYDHDVFLDPMGVLKRHFAQSIQRLCKIDISPQLEQDCLVFLASPISGKFCPPFKILQSYLLTFGTRREHEQIQSIAKLLTRFSFHLSLMEISSFIFPSIPSPLPLLLNLPPHLHSFWTECLSSIPSYLVRGTYPELPMKVDTEYANAATYSRSVRRNALGQPWNAAKARTEDVTFVSPHENFIMVADGHGGRDAAVWFTAKISKDITDVISSRDWDFAVESQRSEFRLKIQQLYKRVDQDFCDERKADWKTGTSKRDDGCTMAVCLVYNGWFININIGDSKSMLFKLDQATSQYHNLFISRDHDMTHNKVVGVLERGGRACNHEFYKHELYQIDEHGFEISPAEWFQQHDGKLRLAPHPICDRRFPHIATKYINMSDSLGDALFKEGLNEKNHLLSTDASLRDGVFEARPDIGFVRLEDDNDGLGATLDSKYLIFMGTDGFWDLVDTESSVAHPALMQTADDFDVVLSDILCDSFNRTKLTRPLTGEEWRLELKRTCKGLGDHLNDPFAIFRDTLRYRYLDDISLILVGVNLGDSELSLSGEPSSKRRRIYEKGEVAILLDEEDFLFP